MSAGSSGTVQPQSLATGNAGAAASAVDKGVAVSTAVAEAAATSIAQVAVSSCGCSQQAAQALASSTSAALSTNVATASATGNCGTIQRNANAEGVTLAERQGVADEFACCDECRKYAGCNLYVYCPQPGGCDNGYGQIYPFQLCVRLWNRGGVTAGGRGCTLKQSDRVASGQDPNFYFKAPSVPWTSGWLGPAQSAG
eukprot:scaffold14.g1020.t1